MNKKIVQTFPDESLFILKKGIKRKNVKKAKGYVNAEGNMQLSQTDKPDDRPREATDTLTGDTGNIGGGKTGQLPFSKICDATIGQFNIYVNGNTATVSTTLNKGNTTASSYPIGVIYSLDAAPTVQATSTFQLTNLNAGTHTISVSPYCADGTSADIQTKTFEIAGQTSYPIPDFSSMSCDVLKTELDKLKNWYSANQGKLSLSDISDYGNAIKGGNQIYAQKCENKPNVLAGLCDVEITDVKINVNAVATGNDVFFDVAYGGTTGLQPVGVAYSTPTVKNGEIQILNNKNFTLRNLPAGENKVTIYPLCEGNLFGNKSVTKSFTVPPVPTTNTTITGGGGFSGGGGGVGRPPSGGGGAAGSTKSETTANTTLKTEKTTFLGRNWWWLVALATIGYLAYKKKKSKK